MAGKCDAAQLTKTEAEADETHRLAQPTSLRSFPRGAISRWSARSDGCNAAARRLTFGLKET